MAIIKLKITAADAGELKGILSILTSAEIIPEKKREKTPKGAMPIVTHVTTADHVDEQIRKSYLKCLECENEFIPKNNRSQYCSPKCSSKAYNRKYWSTHCKDKNGKTVLKPLLSADSDNDFHAKLKKLAQENPLPNVKRPENYKIFD